MGSTSVLRTLEGARSIRRENTRFPRISVEAVGRAGLEESRGWMGRAGCCESFLFVPCSLDQAFTRRCTSLAQPFFWAFTTLALVLHTWRIFTRLVRVTPNISLDGVLTLSLVHCIGPYPTSNAACVRVAASSLAITCNYHEWPQVLANRRRSL